MRQPCLQAWPGIGRIRPHSEDRPFADLLRRRGAPALHFGRQLTRHESRHSLARTTFHGRRGELRQRYREGQEDQLGALGLVVNILVLWTTLYMDRVLTQLRAKDITVNDEDVERLSSLGSTQFNFLGRYHFALPEAIAHGGFRSLRDPTAVIDDFDPGLHEQ
jgi:hypothetical protein